MEKGQQAKRSPNPTNEARGVFLLWRTCWTLSCLWLAAFVKRKANLITDSWDEVIYDEDLRRILEEIVDKVKRNDPVRGW